MLYITHFEFYSDEITMNYVTCSGHGQHDNSDNPQENVVLGMF